VKLPFAKGLAAQADWGYEAAKICNKLENKK
jgi:hypothetical protein